MFVCVWMCVCGVVWEEDVHIRMWIRVHLCAHLYRDQSSMSNASVFVLSFNNLLNVIYLYECLCATMPLATICM